MAQEDIKFHDFYRGIYIPQTCAFNTIIKSTPVYYKALQQDDFKLQDDISNSIDFLATTDGDILNYVQVMKTEDRNYFNQAMHK